ncbi:MAG: MMPL family transporter [Actinomycetales bacterium]|tara:strand:- start:56 stop:2629 length:2574 start_codon:yes stop_codon:yes gene_type:complete
MAQLLYRLGKFSAKRAFAVIAIWVLLIGTAGAGALLAGGKLGTTMTLDGIPSQDLATSLQETFPEAARASGQVVFHKADGVEFSMAEISGISNVLDSVKALIAVDDVDDPFITQATLDSQRADLAAGLVAISDGKAEIKTNQASLDAGQDQLDAAKSDLEAQAEALQQTLDAMVANNAPGTDQVLAGLAQIKGGLDQIALQQTELTSGQVKLDEGKSELASNEVQLVAGEKLLGTANNFRTVSVGAKTAFATIYFNQPTGQLDEVAAAEVVALIEAQTPDGIQVEYSQSLVFSLDGLLGIGEIIGLAIAALVLAIMLRTFIGAGLPVIAAITGVAISAAITFALSSVIEMTSTTPLLGIMLGLAVGIDYSLFILNRHRRQLKAGVELEESIGLANGTSGNAVVFAGITVVIALLALNLTGVGFLGLMGSAGALAIVVAVSVALTLVPAVLGLAKEKVLTKKERVVRAATGLSSTPEQVHALEEANASHKPVFANKRPWVAIIGVVTVLMIVAVPALSMRLALPDGGAEASDSTAFKSYTLISEAFGPGSNGSLVAIVDVPEQLDQIAELQMQAEVSERLFALDNVSAVLPGGVSTSGLDLMFVLVPEFGPTSAETEQLVFDIRELEKVFPAELNANIEVTGIAAVNIDISQKLADVLPLYLGTVVILSFLLLILVFRSLIVPLVATGGFLLTVGATLGAVVAVYQLGWLSEVLGVTQAGPILSFLPILLIGILFGLAMDYQLFVVSGMREAFVHGKSAKESIDSGIHLGRPVVIAAAIIMVSVFGGFAFSHITMIKPMGFGLAIGVLIDAFLVRLLLVPALMSVIGKAAWYLPKWLDRLLPDVDVEGAKLERLRSQS